MQIPNDAEKQAVWDAYHARRPTRVPLRWNVNPRIILLDPALNPEGFTFEQYSRDPLTLMTVQARFQEYQAQVLSRTCDCPAQIPEQWRFYVDTQNTSDGAYLGAPVRFESEITEVLGAQGLDLVALVPVGHPAKAAPTPPRREGRITWVGF